MCSNSHHATFPLSKPINTGLFGLKEPMQCQATYIWIDGTGEHLRSKTQTLESVPPKLSDYPRWSCDGSSTGQASGRDSTVYLQPVAVFNDPFLGVNARLVLCETYDNTMRPTATNHRIKCSEVMKQAVCHDPWFGIEQEYFLLDKDNYPLGWPKHGYPAPQGHYYCAVGADRIFGREVVETHYRACLTAGISIAGTNSEVTPGQWEYQIGICRGIDASDQLWVSRYILHRVCEQFGVVASLDPRPHVLIGGNWNSSGCHFNFSTIETRADNGAAVIEMAMIKLTLSHANHLLVYDPNLGEDNARRLTGRFETSKMDEFTWSYDDRSSSVRVPRDPISNESKGYFEDRRPSSNADPYQVATALVATICLE